MFYAEEKRSNKERLITRKGKIVRFLFWSATVLSMVLVNLSVVFSVTIWTHSLKHGNYDLVLGSLYLTVLFGVTALMDSVLCILLYNKIIKYNRRNKLINDKLSRKKGN